MRTAPPKSYTLALRMIFFWLTPKVWSETVVIVLEEAVQEDGDVADGVVVADVI